jgi:hypothetical protein
MKKLAILLILAVIVVWALIFTAPTPQRLTPAERQDSLDPERKIGKG